MSCKKGHGMAELTFEKCQPRFIFTCHSLGLRSLLFSKFFYRYNYLKITQFCLAIPYGYIANQSKLHKLDSR